MKRLKFFIVLVIVFFASVGYAYTPAEEDCLEEFFLCMQAIDTGLPSAETEFQQCMIRDELCMFFCDIQ